LGELAGALSHHLRVGLDTSLFIYHLESRSRYSDTTTAIFQQLERGSFEGVTSVLTLMELAVKPLQLGRPDVADEYVVLLDREAPSLQLNRHGSPSWTHYRPAFPPGKTPQGPGVHHIITRWDQQTISSARTKRTA